jgi:hypothetical protein
MARSLMGELGTPTFLEEEEHWVIDGNTPLLGVAGAKFYTEHAERNFVDSHAAVLGADKSQRDFLGRWKPEQSDDYIRTSREVVSNLQEMVALGIRVNDPRISEENVTLAFQVHLLCWLPEDEVFVQMRGLDRRQYLQKEVTEGAAEEAVSEVR